MAAPEPYTRLNAYTDWSANNPGDPHLGQDFDEDFDDVARFSTEMLARIALIQRDDGKLAPGVIDSEDTFDAAFLAQLKADIAASGLNGIQGPIGPQGEVGPAGAQGPLGPPLPWIASTGVPSTNIGVATQLFLNVSNGDVYQKTSASSWVLIGNIRGPQGVGGGGVTDHGLLVGLSDPDHPISAVQGLQTALDDLETAIVAAGSAQKNVYRQASAPTANLNAGDLWFDSDANDRLFRWDGTAWIDVADKRIDTALVNAGLAITAAAGAQGTADGKVTVFFGSSNPASPRVGDLWVRTDQGNKLYRWSGSVWADVQDAAIADAINAAADAQATADGKIDTYYQAAAPIGASLGDLWFDTDDGNHPYRHNGAQWVSIRDAAIAQAAAAAASAIATASQALAEVEVIADGVVEVFFQGSQPTGAVGDLWINTALGNQLHRYNGTQWVSVQDAALQNALTNAALAQATADGKIRAFYQTTAPTSGQSPATGDLWYDTDDQFRPYRFNGSAWQDISYILGVAGGLITGVSIANGVITAAKLNVTTLSSITANIGTVTAGLIQSTNGQVSFDLNSARIILNNGSVMQVQGVGFGSASQFVEWFGPSLASVDQCTELNAMAYKKIDGSAYFGGALSAGTLFSSKATSDVLPNATVTLGPFGTNGGPISIVLSATAHATYFLTGSQSPNTSFPNSGIIQLYRTIAGGSEQLVGTLNLTGSCNHNLYDAGQNRTRVVSTLGGSLTYTDTAGGTQARTYRATMISRTMHHDAETQLISLASTEQ